MVEVKNIAGLVLAHGGSRRMGQDKALLRYNDQSFLDIATTLLNRVGIDDIYINNAENMTDLIASIGPVGGIYTALKTHPNIMLWLVLPVDMPLLNEGVLTSLLDGLGEADIARFDGEMFPLLVKKTGAMCQHVNQLATDQGRSYSMRQFMQPFKVEILPKPQGIENEFININSPEDYRTICG